LCTGLEGDAGDYRGIFGRRIGVRAAFRAVQEHLGKPSVVEAPDAGCVADAGMLEGEALMSPTIAGEVPRS
jgi:hypothetical protein